MWTRHSYVCESRYGKKGRYKDGMNKLQKDTSGDEGS
jgi:hypothetical protein